MCQSKAHKKISLCRYLCIFLMQRAAGIKPHTLAGDTGASRSPPNLNYEGRAGGAEHFRSLAMATRVLLLDTEFLETVFSLTVRVSSSPAGLYS